MLSVSAEYRGKKVASALVKASEDWAIEKGCKTMKLGNSAPKDSELPTKSFLDGWYKRMGYSPTEVISMADVYPSAAELELVPNAITFY